MLFVDLFMAGGIVMFPLAGFSIVAIALIIERLRFWYRINRLQRRVIREVLAAYRQDSNTAFLILKNNANLPIARIFLEALEVEQASPQAFRLAMESATQAELPLLRRFTTIFDAIVATAPLLGLLGTVLGLIRTFASLDLGDISRGSAVQVTGGISEALVSTASGLVVALFVVLFSSAFRGLYRRQVAQIQEYGTQLEMFHLIRYESDRTGTPIPIGRE